MQNLEAIIDFRCMDEDCASNISFNLMQLNNNDEVVKCYQCHQQYEFNDEIFIDKLERLKKLLLVINASSDLLDDCNVGIKTMTEEILVPYKLLLARLNANINIQVGEKIISFHFRLEPLNEEQTIR